MAGTAAAATEHTVEVSAKDHAVRKVKLYLNRAEISREISKIELKAGQNRVVIKNLPASLLDDSLRVTCQATAPTLLGEVVAKLQSKPQERDAELDRLRDEEAALMTAEENNKTTRDLLREFMKSLKAEYSTFDVFQKSLTEYNSQIKDLQSEHTKISKQLLKIREEINTREFNEQQRNDSLSKSVRVAIYAEKDCEAKFELSFANENASWRPQYEIRAETSALESSSKLDLTFNAEVRQSTDEDWNGVELTLMTTRPTYWSINPPMIYPQTLKFHRAKPTVQSSFGSTAAPQASLFGGPPPMAKIARSAAPPAAMMQMAAAPMPAPPVFETSQREEASVDQQGLNATFAIPGSQTIPSDDQTHTLSITQLSLKANLERIVVPNQSSQIFLRAKVQNDSNYTLLAGQAAIFVDNAYIAKASISGVLPKQSFSCALGHDNALSMQNYGETKKTNQVGLVARSYQVTMSKRYMIKNNSQATIDNVYVYDSFPITDESELSIKHDNPPLEAPEHPSDLGEWTKDADGVDVKWAAADTEHSYQTQLGHSKGRFCWRLSLAASKSIHLSKIYTVSHPASETVLGL